MFDARLVMMLSLAVCLWASGEGRADEPPNRLPAEEAPLDFDAQIAPLLASRCLECHNASDRKGGLDLTRQEAAHTGGDSGPSLVPGDLDASYLWERVTAEEMPPKKPLSAPERQLLQRWIAGGAEWGTNPIDRFRFSSDARAGYDWWALQPIKRPQVPQVQSAVASGNPIDRFIRAKLEANGLQPAPPAERRILIRRLYFDLLGLPPSPAEVTAFMQDDDPQAYEKLVDRLLASPHYGERWARHWLDIARFGESHGFEHDEPRYNSWPYRDWVVDALNQDLPYDEFARRQLAGDVLQPDDPAAAIPTGFLVAGPFDSVGQSQQSAVMKAVVRQDELEDLLGTVGQTFLGLTINCARCHDHKFDPIRQEEYYRLTSALGGVRHGNRNVLSAAELAEHQRQAANAKLRIADLRKELTTLEAPVRARILQERREGAAPLPAGPTPLARWDFHESLQDRAGQLHAETHGAARLDSTGLVLDGKKSYAASRPLTTDLRAKTLEAWVLLSNLEQGGGAAISVQTFEGNTFDAIVYAEREAARWMAGSDSFQRTESFAGPAETEAHQQAVHIAFVYSEDGLITAYRNGQLYGQPYRSNGPVTYKAGKAHVVFGLRHSPAGGNRLLTGTIRRAAIYDRALTAEEVAASAASTEDYISEAELLERFDANTRQRRDALLEEIKRYESLQKSASKTAYAVVPRQPETAHLLARGDVQQPGAVVSPGGIAAVVGVNADFGLAPDAPEAERRIALARWITSADNPLFARVIVNRLWHYHFGIGLVDTPNDFGFNGGRPSHPELLDWLSAELIARQWSLKKLHRLIVTSAAYRQSSALNPAAVKIDADNRLLWRKSPLRLEAEAVRDATLSIAGQLNSRLGGPGYHDFEIAERQTSFVYPAIDPVGMEFNRRSLYRMWARGGRSGLLDTFDCPDPSTTTPRRAVTTTPLQALALLNNSFVLRMADRFAERIEREVGTEPDRQVARAYELAYGRLPTAEEISSARPFVEQVGLPVLARALLNSNEFLYID